MEKNRPDLKKYFKTGDKPTESQFADLIDSFLNLSEDGISVGAGNEIGIGTTNHKNKLDVKGNAAFGTGYAGNEEAPLNGVIIEGKLGVGTPNPSPDPEIHLDVEGKGQFSQGLDIGGKQVIDQNGTWTGEQTNIQGPPGKDGKDGADGKDGLPGSDGKDGKDGKDGAPGKDGSDASLPAGTIVPFGGPKIPPGWLACDGFEYEISKYEALSKALADSWGKARKSKYFKVPDLRGMFLRGVDAGRGMDPDAKMREGGDGVGSAQMDAIQDHTHGYNEGHVSANHGLDGPNVKNQGHHSRQTTGANGAKVSTETRPKNVYVNYIIKT